MSLQQEGPIRMPQPEQWMSEHPWVCLLGVVLVVVLVVVFA